MSKNVFTRKVLSAVARVLFINNIIRMLMLRWKLYLYFKVFGAEQQRVLYV